MLRPVRLGTVALAMTCAALAGCGAGPSDDQQVKTTVKAFAAATRAKDYQRLCDEILAPALVEKVRSAGLPCEVALQQGLGDVRSPQLTLGAVAVKGDTATADVRTSAAGQAPSRDTLKLQRVRGKWRIASLGSS
jgi:ketosteroid isomerase-like protein